MPQEKRILLVEGVNDAHIVLNLLGANNISARFRGYETQVFIKDQYLEIREKGGVDQVKKFENLLESLAIETKANNDGFLGIMVDANSSLDDRWKSLINRLKDEEIGYENVPENPIQQGVILERQGFLPKLGIWVMPNNQLLGNIENFIRLLVPEQRENLWQLAEKVVVEIPEEEKLFADKDIIKAKVYTFLAWQDEPGRPMGESITRRYFQTDAPDAINFVDWIRKLFGLTSI